MAEQRFVMGQKVKVKAVVYTEYAMPWGSWWNGQEEMDTPEEDMENADATVRPYLPWRRNRVTCVHRVGRANQHKNLYREEFTEYREGYIIGYTFRYTGNYSGPSGGNDDYEPGYLTPDKAHKVWLVAPSLRWQKPYEALEEDIEG